MLNRQCQKTALTFYCFQYHRDADNMTLRVSVGTFVQKLDAEA